VIFQRYIVLHVAYWVPKSRIKDKWTPIYKKHLEFGTEVAVALTDGIFTDEAHIDPDELLGFEEEHGLDVNMLELDARRHDQVSCDGVVKRLSK
jgi:hypothetical protein